MSLEIRTEERGAARRISLAGRLDSETSPQLEEVVSPWLRDDGVTHVLFDLKELRYVSSAGLRLFLLVQQAIDARGGEVVVAEVQPTVQKVFDIAKALPAVSIFRNVAELDEYLDQMQKKVAGELDD